MTPPARRNLLSYIEDLPRFGAREAYLWRDGVRWRRRTYADLHRGALACAGALGAAGVKPGDPVLIQGPDGADWVEALLGTFWAGGVAVPLDPVTPDDLRARIARKAGARLLVAPSGVAPPDGVMRIESGSWAGRRAAIGRAVDPAFRAALNGLANPYGDGHASERIVAVLQSVPLDGALIRKRFYDGAQLVAGTFRHA